MKKIYILLFSFIFLVGIFLRFYNLGKIPGSLDWDEASWGYNAYSILHTGRDEYGIKMPLSFKAFGDYKDPVYVYLDSVSIAIFGLNSFAVRFPSAFFGSLSIIFVFLFLYELFYKEKRRNLISLIGALIFAISPWSIQFSRVAFEATNGLFFVLFGVWLIFLGIRKNKKWQIILGSLSLVVSAYTYHSEKLFSPLIFICLIFYFRKYFFTYRTFFVILFLIFSIGNIFWVKDATTVARGESVLFTSNQTPLLATVVKETAYDLGRNDKFDAILHNRRLVYVSTYLNNYLSAFYPNWLFIRGDLERHHAPGMGILYLASLPGILIGLFLIFDKYKNQTFIVVSWLILAPIAEALAGIPNAERALILLPAFIVFETLGIVFLIEKLKNKNLITYIFCAILCLFYVFNFTYYTNQYFYHTNTDYLEYWQGGYRQAIDFAALNSKGKNIFFDKSIEQGYIFYLFYTKYDPKIYFKKGGSNIIWSKCFNISNAWFGKCEGIKKDDLYVSRFTPSFPNKKIFSFNFFNNDPGVYVFEKE